MKSLMNFLLKMFNSTLPRITYGFVLSITLMSPKVNGFNENPVWIFLGVATLLLTVLSLVHKKKISKSGVIIILVLTVAIVSYIFFSYG